MYVCNHQNENTMQPYAKITAYQSFDKLTRNRNSTTDKVKEVSNAKLWAIRIVSDIMSIITQPVVLITTSIILSIASVLVPPVSIAVAIVAFVVSIVAGVAFGFAVIAKSRGDLDELSKFYAARADLAKDELEDRKRLEFLQKLV